MMNDEHLPYPWGKMGFPIGKHGSNTLYPNAIKSSVTGRKSKRRNYGSLESSRKFHPELRGGILFAEIRVICSFL